MHESPVARNIITYVVGSRSGAGADAEQDIEGSMPRPAPIETEHELIEVVLQVGFPQSGYTPRSQCLRFENSRWIQGSAMCAAIGPSVIALCRTAGMPW
jgi:hypothetical protein